MSDFDRVLQWIDEIYVKIENENDSQERFNLKSRVNHIEINLNRAKSLIEKGEYYHFCKECEQIEFATYVEPTKTNLKEHQMCFHCNFWRERSEEFVNKPGKTFIVNGRTYSDGGNRPNTSRKDFLGCAGRVFKIRMLDGSKEWETNNLWCGGDIPKKYRETTMKNTAEFIEEDIPEVPF